MSLTMWSGFDRSNAHHMFIFAQDPVEGDLTRTLSTIAESLGGSLITRINVDLGFINRL
jgi:hypothetical protein